MKKHLKEPTINEIAGGEIGILKEDIVFAVDAIQSPVSLYDPVYTEGGDTLYVMDQISDKKNKRRKTGWKVLSLNGAIKRPERENATSLSFAFLRERPRWKWPTRSEYPRHRSAGWRKCAEGNEKLFEVRGALCLSEKQLWAA